MKNIRKNIHFLRDLSIANTPKRKVILESASKLQLQSICEICCNLLRGNIPGNIKKFVKYKSLIRRLANKQTPINKKRKLLIQQKGGFLPLLLPAVISMLGGIVGKAIGNRI